MGHDELKELKRRSSDDRKLIEKAAQALAEIDRNQGLSDEHADVLAALRIRLEGKPRARLEDLLSATGDIGTKRDLGDALAGAGERSGDWPEIEEKKRDWPG